jgi:sulfoxide reductase heme-binding subunit YedZ
MSFDSTPKSQKRGLTSIGRLISFTIIVLYCLIALILVLNFTNLYSLVIRSGALFGLASISFASLLASNLKFVFKNFGKPFMKMHHVFAILGIIFITVHPVVFAIEQMTVTVFAPRFDSWIIFWELAGRPALYLIYLGTAAAFLRKKIKNYWRYFHFLNYIALIFGYIHGVLIGTDFVNPVIFVIFTSLIMFSLTVPFYKLYLKKIK